MLGAITEANRLMPDICIALDVTFATQPGVGDASFKMGDGASLSLGPNFHPALYDTMIESAEKYGYTIHPEVTPGNSGTDAWAIQIALEGIPAALIGIPIRNMHSTAETVDIKDLERTARWLAEFMGDLAPDYSVVWSD
jgi:endoglucanase